MFMEKPLSHFPSQLDWIISISLFAQDLGAIRTAGHGAKMQRGVSLFGIRSDRHLASSTQRAQDCPLAFPSRACIGVVQKGQHPFNVGIIAARFNRERSLA